MSPLQRAAPVLFAGAIGIVSGYYIFKPLLASAQQQQAVGPASSATRPEEPSKKPEVKSSI
ncbi:hypothetical protein FA13DRAFT_1784997 [Coprinellus micaceus]|uniref:Uncharacterized protein n=1 Tax=Coprinellus micaceus TaxID=71717 RepID=A0A4Y7TYN4_COPMI|nr:hypothetical protein FA13DRAFT_1784997 [Coprinellus micaceus]